MLVSGGRCQFSPESEAITLIDFTPGPTSGPQLVQSGLIFPAAKLLLATTALHCTDSTLNCRSGLVRKVDQKCFVLKVDLSLVDAFRRFC